VYSAFDVPVLTPIISVHLVPGGLLRISNTMRCYGHNNGASASSRPGGAHMTTSADIRSLEPLLTMNKRPP